MSDRTGIQRTNRIRKIVIDALSESKNGLTFEELFLKVEKEIAARRVDDTYTYLQNYYIAEKRFEAKSKGGYPAKSWLESEAKKEIDDRFSLEEIRKRAVRLMLRKLGISQTAVRSRLIPATTVNGKHRYSQDGWGSLPVFKDLDFATKVFMKAVNHFLDTWGSEVPRALEKPVSDLATIVESLEGLSDIPRLMPRTRKVVWARRRNVPDNPKRLRCYKSLGDTGNRQEPIDN